VSAQRPGARLLSFVHYRLLWFAGLGKDAVMKSRIRDCFLTVLGIAGLMVYVLGCGPSFSPDGTKVAFPVIDWEAKQTAIVVYDIYKKTFETLAVFAGTGFSRDDKAEALTYSVQWMPRGQQVLINSSSLIAILPVVSQGSAQILPLNEEPASLPILPPPVIGNYQYILPKGDHPTTLLRVNLQSWETKSIPIKSKGELASNLFSNGKQLYCADKIDNEGQTVYEIIKLNGEDGTQTVLLQLNEYECGELTGFFRWNQIGDRLAIGSLYQGGGNVVLIRGNSMERMIPVGEQGSQIKIGKLEWSMDEKSLFAAFTKKLDDEDNAQFGVVEVPLEGGSAHEMPLFTGKLGKDIDGISYFQIALSPDGRQIAASSLSFDPDAELEPQDRALYLVDMSHSQWEVTKVPMPVLSASKADAGKRRDKDE
jgi:hypothetical protein